MLSATKAFIQEFNRKVAQKYCLENRRSSGYQYTNEEFEKLHNFDKYESLKDTFILLKASSYDEQSMPDDLAIQVAETYASILSQAGGTIDIKDCIPVSNLDKESRLELEQKNPLVFRIFKQVMR